MNVSTETAEELERMAEENEVDFDEVKETFQERYEELDEKSSGLPDGKKESLALRTTRTNLLKTSRSPTTEVEIAAVGGSIRNWNEYDDDGNVVGDRDVFVGKGLVDQNPDEDMGRDLIASIIVDEDDVELAEVTDAFSDAGNIVRGNFSVSEADIDDFLVLNSSEDTELDVTVPNNREPVLSDIRDAVPEFTIENISDNLSAVERAENGNMYPVNFGVDIRRIEADIYDGYKDPSEGNGTYTVRDETVFDEDDVVESDVHDPGAGENATPGMTCWTDPEMMEYGSESICEFFGTVTTNDDGIPTMNVDGIVPLYGTETEYDGYTDNRNSGGQDEQVESNVDRTQI